MQGRRVSDRVHGAGRSSCLTAPQVRAAQAIYAPVVNPRTGEEVFPGVEPGSGPRWTVNAEGAGRWVCLKISSGTRSSRIELRFPHARCREALRSGKERHRRHSERDLARHQTVRQPWREARHLPRVGRYQCSAAIVSELLRAVGGDAWRVRIHRSVRLYMAPEMGHVEEARPKCVRWLTALEQWREEGKAPANMLASQLADGRVVRTRPLCRFQDCPIEGRAVSTTPATSSAGLHRCSDSLVKETCVRRRNPAVETNRRCQQMKESNGRVL